MVEIFAVVHVLLKYYLVKYCDIDRSGNLRAEDLQNIAKKEKIRMLLIPLFITLIITIISVQFFYWSTNSLYKSIDINTWLLGIIGIVFTTFPPVSIKLPTFWSRVHRRGTFTEVLRQDKGISLHMVTGFYLILIGGAIRLVLIL